MVSVLVNTHVIPSSWKEYDLQEGLQNFLVVIEMVLFAITHYFVFSHKPYIDPAAAEIPCIATCFRMLDIRDVAGDVKEHFVDPIPRPKFRSGRRSGASTGSASEERGGSSEEAPLLRAKGQRPNVRACMEPERGGDSDGGVRSVELSDLSYDVVTYRELESRSDYGLRSSMIANACMEVPEERGEESTTSSDSSSEIMEAHS